MQEKEIKVKVSDSKKLISYLMQHGAKILNQAKEKTIRLDTPGEDLEKRGVFLRVRSGSKSTITLKEKIGEDTTVRTRKETEFEISDVDQMAYILKTLGFSKAKIMEKYRVNFLYKGAKLSLDELPFGIYLEIEGSEEQVSDISRELEVKPDEKILVTYWDLFANHKKKTGETGENIEFPQKYSSSLFSSLTV